MIVLEPGEELTDDPLSGDTERWIIDRSVMGSSTRSSLVVVKPQFCDISTNPLIPTDRRVYELSLLSDACEPATAPAVFTRQVKFWYPEQMRAQRAIASEKIDSTVAPPPELNRDYDIDRGWLLNRKRYPWIPAEVFDDGIRTYVVLPEQARTGELPILYMLEGGERHVLNYALRGDTIVADRVLQKAVLVVGTGDGERTVRIENRNPIRREESDQ
jgi:type IV secretion system protein VirB9